MSKCARDSRSNEEAPTPYTCLLLVMLVVLACRPLEPAAHSTPPSARAPYACVLVSPFVVSQMWESRLSAATQVDAGVETAGAGDEGETWAAGTAADLSAACVIPRA